MLSNVIRYTVKHCIISHITTVSRVQVGIGTGDVAYPTCQSVCQSVCLSGVL